MAGRRTQGLALPDSIIVNVCFNSQQRSYELDRCSTVAELRQRLAEDYGVSVSEMKILLGGSLLADDLTIEGSGVGMESTLFAIQRRSSPVSLKGDAAIFLSQPLIATTTSDANGSDNSPSQTPTNHEDSKAGVSPHPDATESDCSRQLLDQYFVFCKVCKEVRPGRLRVRCSVCGDGAVLVDKGPGSWDDVLTPGRVGGTCQTLHCEQCIPVFYFKCAEQHQGNVSDTVAALHHIRPNRRSVFCITCEDVMSPVVVFPCESSHVMCLSCFISYCTIRLHERRFVQNSQYGYTLPCPAGCPDSLIQEQHHFSIMGQEEYERYKDFAAEECLMAGGGIYCPRLECGSGFIVDAVDSRVICPHCKYVFCRNCREAAHYEECAPISQASGNSQRFSDPDRAARAQWEKQSAHTIHETTKGCPGCGTRTERDGGCMHMKCARCGEDWCWLCVKLWDRECQGAHWFA
ncbi:E3 ubiquitin-protein ligase parkin-like [Littorina saxatilis]|uniref:E3 ubiquitin-protein ligase parkin n=1 Tax=Littorina saxatilis TaxID=31220 RepID=A0AAN9BMT9_9CAEN